VSADEPPVTFTRAGGVGRITLNRPHARNALSAPLLAALLEALRSAAQDPAVRVVVLSGAGPVFCAGADLKEDRGTAKSAPPYSLILSEIMDAPKPVLSVVHGPARAGGLGLVAAADIAIAVDSSTFAFPEVHIGVTPAIIAVPCLAKMNPRSVARYCLTAEVFDAAAAVAAGLLTASAPADRIDELEQAVVGGLLAAAPSALAGTKRLLRDIAAMPADAAFSYAAQLSATFFDSEDAAEGRLAFREKRLPRWRDAGQGEPG
jgi:methylglutaconyl-CoA hydratase